ncbi:MAG: DNA-binding domain-containing protein [Candidatus Competibacteraceae bacterium]|nr:DNA-binding domain-containing protein [Candidatus Competibacteraceae bacterium]
MPAESLLQLQAHRVQRLAELVGFPPRHWEALVQPALLQLAAYTQRLPVRSEGGDEGEGKGKGEAAAVTLLEAILDRTILALRRRRGRLLPPGLPPEQMARHADRWTYGVLTAALLWQSEAQLLRRQVMMFDIGARPLGLWNPWTGSLERIGGCVVYQPDDPSAGVSPRQSTTGWGPLFAARIVPERGLGWLAEDKALFTAWLACLDGAVSSAGVLGELLLQTAESARSPGGSSAPVRSGRSPVDPPTDPVSPARSMPHAALATDAALAADDGRDAVSSSPSSPDPVDHFLDWLKTQLTGEESEAERVRARVHRLPDDRVLLASPGLFQAFVKAYPQAGPWEKLQKTFQKRQLHQRAADGAHLCRFLQPDRHSTLTGYLLSADRLGDGVGVLEVEALLGPLN